MQTQKVIDHIVAWLKNYALKAGAKGFVVGVSGGVDSAVVSTLCALTGLEVLLLEMPIRQKADQVNRAQEHIDHLKKRFTNVKGKTLDLTSLFEHFEGLVHGDVEEDSSKALSLANTRSRFRMLTLYYFGQLQGLLVCGTGNKVEDFGIGFYTKYGDGGVDLSPIADLYKTEVFALAQALQVIESIQNAAPTDGLWDQETTDEVQIGATYPELETIQKDWGHKTEAHYRGRALEVYKIFARRHLATQHKMNPIPVCAIPEELKSEG